MQCPMTFNNPAYDADHECRPDCAWRIVRVNWRADQPVAGAVCAFALVADSTSQVPMEDVRLVSSGE